MLGEVLPGISARRTIPSSRRIGESDTSRRAERSRRLLPWSNAWPGPTARCVRCEPWRAWRFLDLTQGRRRTTAKLERHAWQGRDPVLLRLGPLGKPQLCWSEDRKSSES